MISFLYYTIVTRLPINYDVKSHQNKNISFTKKIDNNNILNKFPLIKSYLRAGRKVNKNFFIDTKFETIDYCVIIITDKIVISFILINFSNLK